MKNSDKNLNVGAEQLNLIKQMSAWQKEEKLANYKELNRYVKQGQILFVGSSLAEQFPVNELLNSYDKRYIVYNRGIGGDIISGLLGAMNERIFDLQPFKIFINIGTNDIDEPDFTEDDLLEKYSRVLKQIIQRLPETKIYILSYYPVNSNIKSRIPEEVSIAMFAHRTNTVINQLNRRLENMAHELHCNYIDVHSILLDSEGNLDPKYTVEGIHLKPNGYEVILKVLAAYFED